MGVVSSGDTPARYRGLDASLPWLALSALGALYLLTSAPSVMPGDSAELTTAAVTLGISHPTGYPLYLLLAKAATIAVPVVSVARLVNLLSVGYMVLALCALVVVLRSLKISRPVTATAVFLLGTTPPLWNAATIAEVYTLHAFLLAVILLLLRWSTPAGFITACLIAGLSLGNHMTSILLLPGLLIWATLMWRDGRLGHTMSTLLRAAGSYLVGASVLVLLFVFDRGKGLNYIDQYALEFPDPRFDDAVGRIGWLLSGSQYEATSGFFHRLFSVELLTGLGQVMGEVVSANAPLVLLGLAGLLVVVLRLSLRADADRPTVVFLLVTAVANLIYLATYTEHFEPVFFTHGFVISAFGLALLIERFVPWDRMRVVIMVCLVLFSVRVVALEFWTISKEGTEIYRRETNVLLSTVEPDAVLFSTWGNSTLLWYSQLVDGANPGVTVVNARPDSWPRLVPQFSGRPLYFESAPPDAPPGVFVPVRHFYRLAAGATNEETTKAE
jgi:hypothetical protein